MTITAPDATATVHTKQKLANAIRDYAPDGRLENLARAAEAGHYDEYESHLNLPITILISDLAAHDAPELARRALKGEFRASRAEVEAWWYDRDGPVRYTGQSHMAVMA